MNFSERLKAAREKRGIDQPQLAKRAGITKSAVNQMESGEVKQAKAENLYALADALEVNARWLATGKGESGIAEPGAKYGSDELVTDEDFVFVDFVSGVCASAGPGYVSWEHERIDKSHAFTRTWMNSKGINPKNSRIIKVVGDSMSPYVFDGDVVLVNLEENRLRSGEVFAINVDGETRIKRLIRRADGAVEIRSDNNSPQYQAEILRGSDIDKLQIIGKVKWRGG